MLAFVMFWAYVSFSQYLIIWSGNLPEEIPWYTAAALRRLGLGRHRIVSSIRAAVSHAVARPPSTEFAACW